MMLDPEVPSVVFVVVVPEDGEEVVEPLPPFEV